MPPSNRRQFLLTSASIGSGLLLAGCGSSSGSGASSTAKRPPISKEPGNLSILEWAGYEAGGTKAQKYGLWAGTPYTKKFGSNSVTYTYIVNDDEAINKARENPDGFDLMHPCGYDVPNYVQADLLQPWDLDLLPSWKNQIPELAQLGKYQGTQYMIPWDWGYGSLTYNTDKVDPADATGWELAWNPKYAGKISLWNGSTVNLEIAGRLLGVPDMDTMSTADIARAQQKLTQQKPLNKFYWSSEFTQLQPALASGDLWIAYTWQDSYVAMLAKKLPFAYMQPTQGRLGWNCGFVLSKNTKNYYHCHEYVESFINHRACVQMTNLFSYGTSDKTITASELTNKHLATALDIGDVEQALSPPKTYLQRYEPNRQAYEVAWAQVVA